MIPNKINDYGEFNLPPYLIEFFRKAQSINGILDAADEQFNDLETAAFAMFTEVWIADAVGEQLDVLGIHVGLRREGRDDDSYRTLLILKIFINIAGATPNAFISAVKNLFGATIVELDFRPPAKVEVLQNGSINLFIQGNIEDDVGDLLIDNNGNSIIFSQPDDISEDILYDMLPNGVGLLIGAFLIDDVGDFIIDNEDNNIEVY